MKLVNTDYCIELDLKENEVNILVIEHPGILSAIVNEMYKQSKGEDGGFILSDKDKLFKFNKEIALILEPFTIDCNEKKIITKLYQELKIQVDEYMSEETLKLNARIIEYLDKATFKVPYLTTFQLDFDITGLFKLLGVELEYNETTICQNVIAYLRALTQLCGYSTVVFLKLKSFLSTEEIKSLYEFAFYHKINLILIESASRTLIQGEKICIIDKDMCIIKY